MWRADNTNKLVNAYLGLVELLRADPHGKSDAILSFLKERGLYIKHMFSLFKQQQPSF